MKVPSALCIILLTLAFSQTAPTISEITGTVINEQEFEIDISGSGFVHVKNEDEQGTDVVMLGGSYCKDSRTRCRVKNKDIRGGGDSTRMLRVPITIGEPADDLRLILVNPDGSESQVQYAIKNIKPPKR